MGKIGVIESLMENCDKIIIGGGMVFTFLKARGLETGSSLVEEDQLDLAKKLGAMAKEKGIDFILPTDVIVADKFAADAQTQTVKVEEIPEGWMGLDNGPESTKLIQDALGDARPSSGTAPWVSSSSRPSPRAPSPSPTRSPTSPARAASPSSVVATRSRRWRRLASPTRCRTSRPAV